MGAPNVIVVMGPAGAGKTVVGRALAGALDWRFIEGDDFHSEASLAKMTHGEPLTDDDRAPWLAALRAAIGDVIQANDHAVLACSALKHAYRVALIPADAGEGAVRFVFLDVPADVLRQRLATRVGHFAPPELLPSQLATLEIPRHAVRIDGTRSPSDIVRDIRAAIGV